MEMSEVEQRSRMEAMHDMFQTEGWAHLSKLAEENVRALNDIGIVKDEKDLFFRKGKIQALRELLFLPEQVKNAV